MSNNLNVLYEDNHLIIVEKPAGVLTQSGSLNLPNILSQVKEYIKVKYNKQGNVFVGMVQRLDTNVGGLICFAKTSKAASRISEEIRNQRFEKKYLTIVEGIINTKEEIKLTNYIKKDSYNKKAIITNNSKDKKSILTFKSLNSTNNLSLLEVNLITGRFHQIRAQLAHYGTPIYGDIKYGNKSDSKEIALYAHYLKFKHPTKDEFITITNYPSSSIFKLLEK